MATCKEPITGRTIGSLIGGGGGGGGPSALLAPPARTPMDLSKQHSKQDKTGEVERNYKMFADPIFINPLRYICKTKKQGCMILQLGIYYLLTNISEGTAFLLQGLTYTETLQFENKK